MKIKFDSKMNAGAEASLNRHAVSLYEDRGKHVIGIVELAHLERNQAAPDADKEEWDRLDRAGTAAA